MGTRKPGPLKDAVDAAIKGVLYRYLAATNGKVSLAAQNAGIHRTSFYNLMKRHGIKIERAKIVQKPSS